MGSQRIERRRKKRPGPQSLATIHWKHADGTEAESHPLPLPHAQALLHAYVAAFPQPRFWLETPIPLVPAAEL
jgi:hypothetical protein